MGEGTATMQANFSHPAVGGRKAGDQSDKEKARREKKI